MKIFSERLKELRVNAGLSQAELAERVHVSKAAISNYELYARNPSPNIIVSLAKVFHVSADYLLGIESKKQTIDVTDLSDEEIKIIENVVALLRKKKD